MYQSINQSIDRSIDHSINQSINRSINRSLNQSIKQSINQSINHSINQSINQTINQSINQSNNQSINQSLIHGEGILPPHSRYRELSYMQITQTGVTQIYRVGQIKRGHLTVFLVTSEPFIKLNYFGRYKIHRTTSDMMPVLS